MTSSTALARPPLARDRECLATGVGSGLARHLGAPVWSIRGVFLALTLCGGAGIALYVWMWAFMPWVENEVEGGGAPTRRAPVAWLLAVLGAMALVSFAGAREAFGAGTAESTLTALLAVALLAGAGLWADLIDRPDTARGPRHALLIRLIAVVLLSILLILLLTGEPTAGSIVGVLAALAGILIVLSSTLLRQWRELAGERVRRIREEQRSEMAAHLHDSVLQTLALIQNRAGASSEAARLARAQERELRAWLYDGDAPADSDLPTDLRDYAGALELDFPVRIDVVSAGLSTQRASGELAGAAREAMLNAARHAGGEVSVYIEGSADAVDVFIRDRRTGFDLAEVPGDRLGVRESIIGRMRRSGGIATVRSSATGTEVHLHVKESRG